MPLNCFQTSIGCSGRWMWGLSGQHLARLCAAHHFSGRSPPAALRAGCGSLSGCFWYLSTVWSESYGADLEMSYLSSWHIVVISLPDWPDLTIATEVETEDIYLTLSETSKQFCQSWPHMFHSLSLCSSIFHSLLGREGYLPGISAEQRPRYRRCCSSLGNSPNRTKTHSGMVPLYSSSFPVRCWGCCSCCGLQNQCEFFLLCHGASCFLVNSICHGANN